MKKIFLVIFISFFSCTNFEVNKKNIHLLNAKEEENKPFSNQGIIKTLGRLLKKIQIIRFLEKIDDIDSCKKEELKELSFLKWKNIDTTSTKSFCKDLSQILNTKYNNSLEKRHLYRIRNLSENIKDLEEIETYLDSIIQKNLPQILSQSPLIPDIPFSLIPHDLYTALNSDDKNSWIGFFIRPLAKKEDNFSLNPFSPDFRYNENLANRISEVPCSICKSVLNKLLGEHNSLCSYLNQLSKALTKENVDFGEIEKIIEKLNKIIPFFITIVGNQNYTSSSLTHLLDRILEHDNFNCESNIADSKLEKNSTKLEGEIQVIIRNVESSKEDGELLDSFQRFLGDLSKTFSCMIPINKGITQPNSLELSLGDKESQSQQKASLTQQGDNLENKKRNLISNLDLIIQRLGKKEEERFKSFIGQIEKLIERIKDIQTITDLNVLELLEIDLLIQKIEQSEKEKSTTKKSRKGKGKPRKSKKLTKEEETQITKKKEQLRKQLVIIRQEEVRKDFISSIDQDNKTLEELLALEKQIDSFIQKTNTEARKIEKKERENKKKQAEITQKKLNSAKSNMISNLPIVEKVSTKDKTLLDQQKQTLIDKINQTKEVNSFPDITQFINNLTQAKGKEVLDTLIKTKIEEYKQIPEDNLNTKETKLEEIQNLIKEYENLSK